MSVVVLEKLRLALLGLLVLIGLSLLSNAASAQTYSFSYTGAKETWQPPVSGTYRVTAIGAQGGGSTGFGLKGGRGTEISATFTLSAGTIYSLAAGKAGDTDGRAGGGGGGTFFVETGSADMPLLVAGGGGGAGLNYTGDDAATSFVSSGAGLGGQSFGAASGGGGFYGDGGDGSGTGSGGRSWANGLAAGAGGPGSGSVRGGFGGGGAGSGDYLADDRVCGGGGGGYAGGNGGVAGGPSTGGGSFSSGSDTSISAASSGGSGSLIIEFIPDVDTTAEATSAIASFLTSRNQLLLSSQPDIGQFIARFYGTSSPGTVSVMGYSATTGLPLDVQVGEDATSFSYSSARDAIDGVAPSETVRNLAFWAEGSYARASDDTLFGVVHVGGDYLLTDHVLVGIAAEIDSTRQDGNTATVSGTGYSVGPYMTIKLSEHLFLDARVAGGQSFNEITQDGAPTDSFTGTRWLGSTTLAGQFDAGIVRISPSAKLAAITETTAAYSDHNGDTVPSVTATTATVELGPKLSLIPEQPGDFSPYLGLSGIWTFYSSESAGTDPDSAALRARVEAGSTLGSANGLSARASVYYDGLGSQWRAWGAGLGIAAALH
ncbi:autotransporter outer membrane beta-barrel domain-containing protein [Devosia sp.]|uniref:autotransporter outer membrane beta-barrel domain-containing protein n=1 Tax=Devosia sp. TaxID=1871048 RepID=UPI003BAB9FAC